jgi:ubiquinone/menaquinone biosynthesis C-methylase UbiE
MHDRHGAKQPERFDPARAARLDDPERFRYLSVPDVLALLDPAQGTRVLDFGTGTGAYAIGIAKLRPDLHVIALDEQPEMLAILREKLAREPLHNLTVMLSGEHELPVVERVLAINVLHEAGDDALGEMRAALTRGGRALIVDWNADAERPVGPPKDHVYSPAQARERLVHHGFRVLEEKLLRYHYAIVGAQSDS